jgi:FSR family fosmidomycin resistance protein-like MFS transporter
MSLIGFSSSYILLLFMVGSAGLGSAAFHPPAFSSIVRSNESSKGRAMGFFLSSGNTGYFLGPFVAGALGFTFGLTGMLCLLPLGLLVSVILFKFSRKGITQSHQIDLGYRSANKRLVGLLATITTLRSIAVQTTVTFLPLYFVAQGASLLVATGIASMWLGVAVIGQLFGGWISDRVGRTPVIASSLLVGGVLFYGFLLTGGAISLILLALSGAALFANWSVIVVSASEAAPSNVGAVSGLMLGFSIGVGGIAALGFGAMADAFGLSQVFLIITAFAIVAGLLAFLLPSFTEAPVYSAVGSA